MRTLAEVLAKLRAGGAGLLGLARTERFVPSPMSPEAVRALRLPDGDPLPPELAEWLAYDGHALGIVDARTGLLLVAPLREILARWAKQTLAPVTPSSDPEGGPSSGPDVWSEDDMVAAWVEALPGRGLADAFAIEITHMPGSQEHLLIVDSSQVRVLGCDKRLEFWWKYDSLRELIERWFLAPVPGG